MTSLELRIEPKTIKPKSDLQEAFPQSRNMVDAWLVEALKANSFTLKEQALLQDVHTILFRALRVRDKPEVLMINLAAPETMELVTDLLSSNPPSEDSLVSSPDLLAARKEIQNLLSKNPERAEFIGEALIHGYKQVSSPFSSPSSVPVLELNAA